MSRKDNMHYLSFTCNVVVINSPVIVLERMLTHVNFPLLCNVVVRNVLVFVLEGNITCVRFIS